MYGIFMESFVILKLYTGLKPLLLLFAAAWLYLLFTEKNKTRRLLFVTAPILIIALFLFPLSRKYFVALLDGTIYYRVLWTIPYGVIVVYAACRLFEKHRRIGLLVMTAIIVLCGSLVYKSPYISKAENAYHIPETAVKICELIAPEEDGDFVKVVVPEELVYFIRQYDARIRMPYGRDMIESQWGYYHEVHQIMENADGIELEKLLEVLRPQYCRYIVLSPAKKVIGDPEKLGLICLAEIDGYRIYSDPVTEKALAELEEAYY